MINENLYQHSMLVIQIALLTTLSWVDCVPINSAGNYKNYHDEHQGNKAFYTRQPNHLGGHRWEQQPQTSASPPEVEDFRRSYTNQNQFKRHAMLSPGEKVTHGTFQRNPLEQFSTTSGSSAGNNFYYKYEEPQQHSNHILRHQNQHHRQTFASEEETQEYIHNKLPDRKCNSNINCRQSQPHHPNQYDVNNLRREETPFMSKEPWIVDPHQPSDNRIFRERNHQHERNRFQQQPFDATQIKRQQQRQQEAQPNYVAKDFSPVQMRDPSKSAGIVDGDSTLIEYDVSDKDVTYETIMEVEDAN